MLLLLSGHSGGISGDALPFLKLCGQGAAPSTVLTVPVVLLCGLDGAVPALAGLNACVLHGGLLEGDAHAGGLDGAVPLLPFT